MARGIPTTAPIMVRLMITPAISRTKPRTAPITRPVNSMIMTTRCQINQKGYRNQGIFFFSFVTYFSIMLFVNRCQKFQGASSFHKDFRVAFETLLYPNAHVIKMDNIGFYMFCDAGWRGRRIFFSGFWYNSFRLKK